jgi:hypothetical protein
VVVRYSLLWAYVGEQIQLLHVVSSHAFFYQVVLWKQESFLMPGLLP